MKKTIVGFLSCWAMASYGTTVCPSGPAKAHVAFALNTEAAVMGALIATTQVTSLFVACTPETFDTIAGINSLERTATARYQKDAHVISIIRLSN